PLRKPNPERGPSMGEHADTSVTIQDPSLAERTQETVHTLVGDGVAGRLAAGDPTLWGADAESEARVRLSWTTAHKTSRPLIGEIETLRSQLHEEGANRIVLAGMGGSSLAPEVIAATAGRSEERRVGKEWRSRGVEEREQKKSKVMSSTDGKYREAH